MSKLFGIIGAMDIEVSGIVSSMTNVQSVDISNITFYTGNLADKRVVVAKCGIGKVFAAICAQTMILKFAPNVIINSGVAATLSKEIGVLDIAISKNVVQHDMDTSAIGDPVGLISGINKVFIDANKEASNALQKACDMLNCKSLVGTIASGDQFISNNDVKSRIVENFGAIACEMEGASIGHTCYVNNVPFCVLRAISDGDAAEMDYQEFAPLAAKQSIEIVKKFIEIY